MKIEHRVAIIAAFIAMQCGGADLRLERSATGAAAETLAVSLASTAAVPASSLTGIQFDLTYDTSALNVTVNVGPAAENAGKTIATAALGTRGQRVIVFGFNHNTLTDGPVALVHVSAKAGSAAGMKIRLTAGVGTTRDGIPVAVPLRQPEQVVR